MFIEGIVMSIAMISVSFYEQKAMLVNMEKDFERRLNYKTHMKPITVFSHFEEQISTDRQKLLGRVGNKG